MPHSYAYISMNLDNLAVNRARIHLRTGKLRGHAVAIKLSPLVLRLPAPSLL
jgi:hypothetical protein